MGAGVRLDLGTDGEFLFDEAGAFFPGPIGDAVEETGVFNFDNGVFSHLWDTRTLTEFMAYTQCYLSDYRIRWAALTTT